jgi:hypothetical protein
LPNISNLLLPVSTVALTVTPIGTIALALVLFVVADLAIAVFIARMIAARRKAAENSVVMLDGVMLNGVMIDRDMPMHLLRRTEPALRSHRPIGVVEMQVRWRHAAEAHRRNRETNRQGR